MRKYIKLSILALVASVFWQQTLLSQIDRELENKYWTYRDRFRNYFTRIGAEAGQSQTAAHVTQKEAKSLKFQLQNGTEAPVGTPNSYVMEVNFGDAVIDQGWYMMVLASEYWLLKNKGQTNTDAFKALCNELYFCINAMERQDGNAERIFDLSLQSQNLNGFFVRSDHQPDYLTQLNQHNIPHNPIEWVTSGGVNGPQFSTIDSSNAIRVYDQDSFRVDIRADSTATWWQGGPGQLGAHLNWGNEMSQDQVYGVLMGFKAILNWVDSDLEVDPDGSDPTLPNKNLHQWIKDITHRIMLHISKTHVGLFGVKDQDDLKKEAEAACKHITAFPYFRLDSTLLDTPIIVEVIVTPDSVRFDTIFYETKDTNASAWFPGSTYRTCNIFDKLAELKASNYIFKEANYIITNPVRNDGLVTRGAVVTPLAYPFKSLGESITGHTYPEPYMKLRDNYNVYRWLLNAGYLASMANPKVFHSVQLGSVALVTGGLLIWGGENKEQGLKTIEQLTIRCYGKLISPDAMSLCVLGMNLNFQNPNLYKRIWERLPTSSVLKAATKDGLPLNLMQNLAIASGEWDHQTFQDWCSYHEYPYSEILYAMMNNKTPLKNKAHYEAALINAQCEGIWGFGNPDNWGDKIPAQDQFKPFVKGHLFSNRKPNTKKDSFSVAQHEAGIDYMLLYNMYEMANTLHWGGKIEKPNTNKQCPCRQDTVYNRGNLVNSTYDQYNGLVDFKYGNRQITRQDGLFAIPNKPIGDDTIHPHYDYYNQFKLRTPAYLFHDLEVQGNFSQDNTISIAQDYRLCRATLDLKAYSHLRTLPNNDAEFPSLIEVMETSIIEMRADSKITIEDNTRLVVEKGGKLIFHPGAQIILNGPNAVLHIKGDVELKDNVTFKVLGGQNGKGYVIWEGHYEDTGRTGRLLAGNNCTVEFTQNNTGIKALETRGNAGFETPHNLTKLKIYDCTVLIGDSSRLTNHADSGVFEQVGFRGNFGPNINPSYDYKLTAQGVYQLGNKNAFRNCDFYTCQQGLTAFGHGNHYPLILENVNFYDCQTGLRNDGHRIYWKDGVVDRSAPPGSGVTELATYNSVFGMGQQGMSYFQNVGLHMGRANPVNPAPTGVDIMGMHLHGNGRQYIYKSNISSGDYGIYANQQGIYSWCSQYLNNTKQFALGTRASLGIAGERWNTVHHDPGITFTEDFKAIYGWEELKLYLQNGKNDFHGSSANGFEKNVIEAYLNPLLMYATSTSNPSNRALRASLNGWGLRPNAGSGLIPYPGPSNNSNINLWTFSLSGVGPGNINWFDINDNQHYNQVYGQQWEMDRDAACLNMSIGPWNYGGVIAGMGGSGGGTGTLDPKDVADVLYGGGNGQSSGDVQGVFVQKMHPNAATVKDLMDNFYRVAVIKPLKYDSIIDYASQLSFINFPDSIALVNYEIYQLAQDLYTQIKSDENYSEAARLTLANNLKSKLITWSNALMIKSTEPAGNWRHFKFELVRDRALIHRHFNERNDALVWLDQEIPNFQEPFEVRELQNWRCLIATEQEYLDGNISIDDLFNYGCLSHLVNPELNQAHIWQATDFNSVNNGDDWVEEQEGSGGAPNPDGMDGNLIQLEEGLTVYPNPSAGVFYYKNPELKDILKIELFSSNGRLVKTLTNPSAEGKIDFSNQTNGLYIISFKLSDKDLRTKVLLMK